MLERFLASDGRRIEVLEQTLRRRGGDAAIAEAEAEHLRRKLTHGYTEANGRLQAKVETQRREIVRLTKELSETKGKLEEARRKLPIRGYRFDDLV